MNTYTDRAELIEAIVAALEGAEYSLLYTIVLLLT